MLTKEQAIALLSLEVVPALGCTEPVCVALCAADAAHAAKGAPKRVEIDVCPSIYKNAKAVAIPNFSRPGLEYAAALGAMIARPELGLELFSKIVPEISEAAIHLVEAGSVAIHINEQESGVYVAAKVFGDGIGESIIRNGHANIVLTRCNGEVLYQNPVQGNGHESLIDALCDMRLSQIRELVEALSYADIRFMLDGRDMNEGLADVGLSDPGSAGLARGFQDMPDIAGDGLLKRVVLRTTACAESRMTGVPRSVMSSAGSGNHGITAIIPLCELARHLNKSDEELARALAFSHLLNIYIKHYSGRLSPLCGCGSSAATAASAAMVWLLGGNDTRIAAAINNMAGSITGMICDGAKVGCAIKLGVAAGTALICAYLALNGIALPSGNGIVAAEPEETIRNIGRISQEGMRLTDNTILDIMANSNNSFARMPGAIG